MVCDRPYLIFFSSFELGEIIFGVEISNILCLFLIELHLALQLRNNFFKLSDMTVHKVDFFLNYNIGYI